MIKLVAGGRYSWTVVQQGKAVAGAGGRYKVNGDSYTEKVTSPLATTTRPWLATVSISHGRLRMASGITWERSKSVQSPRKSMSYGNLPPDKLKKHSAVAALQLSHFENAPKVRLIV